jgi:signal transduction histidine kinase
MISRRMTKAQLVARIAQLEAELEKTGAERTEALEQQTATSEILSVISSSPTDVQPVLDAIAESAARLTNALYGCTFLVMDHQLHLAALHLPGGENRDEFARAYPVPLDDRTLATRVARDGVIFNIADTETEPSLPEPQRERARRLGARALLIVPIVRDGRTVGMITTGRRDAGAFTGQQVVLLKTFADQAVIAIENVRLFNEIESRNRELTEALNRETATGEILRVINSSPTSVEPVFDAILASGMQLCQAAVGLLFLVEGDMLRLVADRGAAREFVEPRRAWHRTGPLTGLGRAVRERRTVHIEDIKADRAYAERDPNRLQTVELLGARTGVWVPLLKEAMPVGVLVTWRREVRPFTPVEIDVLTTFANQAVIALENVRLFKELEARTQDLTRSVGELRALGEVGQAISSTLDLQTVLSTIVARATQLSGTDAGVIYEYDEQREVFEPRATDRLEEEIVRMLVATHVHKGQGATGRLAEVPEPIQVTDVRDLAEQIPIRDAFVRAGYRALLAVPLVREDRLVGGLSVVRKTPGAFAVETVNLLRTFATQSALAIQNARLFREIEEKSRQLEVASQHKSEFLANMSHELRTPLNAIIGFSEVLSERMFGELNEKQEEYLKDIYASGTHLLSLINDILDLSKIEAGRMELELTDFDLPQAIDNALTLVRERAGRRGVALHQSAEANLGEINGDERKVKQVLLNLLSNALKFTPEGGRVELRARAVDGMAEISVTDTGVGIAAEDQEAVFEEFRQVGTADKKAEGTGLGLTLCRKFVELHGGKIWVTSQVGAGSTFTFTIPVRTGE